MRGAADRIWLVGSMGAGKSVVGVALANELGWTLLDNDAELESATGSNAPKLSAQGPAALHERESEQLHRAAGLPAPYVAGVAASVAERPADLELIRRTGFVVYLQASAETLAKRVGDGGGRPWLGDDPLAWLAARLREREHAYLSVADLVVDVDHLAPKGIAAVIADAWRRDKVNES
jgi:shikimate kinase